MLIWKSKQKLGKVWIVCANTERCWKEDSHEKDFGKSFRSQENSFLYRLTRVYRIFLASPIALSAQDNGSKGLKIPIPNLSFNVNEAKSPKETSLSLMILFLVTILSLAPAIVMSLTSFTKIVIVFDFVRRALSLQNLPPNQVMMGLALFVTFFIMAPTIGKVNDQALQPFLNGKIDQTQFMEGSMKHLREFMIRQLGKDGTKDVALFLRIGKVQNVKSFEDVPSYVLVPAFMLSEIKKHLL